MPVFVLFFHIYEAFMSYSCVLTIIVRRYEITGIYFHFFPYFCAAAVLLIRANLLTLTLSAFISAHQLEPLQQ